MSLKDSYEPLRLAALDSADDAGSQVYLFHVPDGVDPSALDGLILNLDGGPASTSFTAPTTKQQFEFHPALTPANARLLLPSSSGSIDGGLQIAKHSIAQSFQIRLAHPKYRQSQAPSMSDSATSTSTSAPSTSSAPSVRRKPPAQPWDRLNGVFKPAGSNLDGPLPPLVSTSSSSAAPPALPSLATPSASQASQSTEKSASKSKKSRKSASRGTEIAAAPPPPPSSQETPKKSKKSSIRKSLGDADADAAGDVSMASHEGNASTLPPVSQKKKSKDKDKDKDGGSSKSKKRDREEEAVASESNLSVGVSADDGVTTPSPKKSKKVKKEKKRKSGEL